MVTSKPCLILQWFISYWPILWLRPLVFVKVFKHCTHGFIITKLIRFFFAWIGIGIQGQPSVSCLDRRQSFMTRSIYPSAIPKWTVIRIICHQIWLLIIFLCIVSPSSFATAIFWAVLLLLFRISTHMPCRFSLYWHVTDTPLNNATDYCKVTAFCNLEISILTSLQPLLRDPE